MRIAIVTETFCPSVNGVVTRLCRTIRGLRARGDRVLVVAPGGGPDVVEGAEVVGATSMPCPVYPEVQMAVSTPRVRARLAGFRPDLVHVVNPAVLGLAGVRCARSARVPLVASFHTYLPEYLRHYGLGLFENLAWELLRSIHANADVNLCISDPVARDLVQRGFERVLVAWRGGVDTDLFDPARAADAARAELTGGLSVDRLILHVGRLAAEKRIDTLRDVLPRLPGAHLAVVGDGPDREALERRFAGLPVTFTGYLSGERLAAAYASSDALIFPSTTETLGLVALEAMASGLPVVAARAGGIPDVVEHERNGLLFEPGDPLSAAAALGRALAAGAEREELRSGGLATARAWSWDGAVDELREVYRGLVESGRREVLTG